MTSNHYCSSHAMGWVERPDILNPNVPNVETLLKPHVCILHASASCIHLRLRSQLTSRSLGCLWSTPEEIWSPAMACHSLQQTSLCSLLGRANLDGETIAIKRPCNRSFSILVILITSQTSCATKITAQLSSHGVRLHADAHENNGQRKFQTVPAENGKTAVLGANLLPRLLGESDAVDKKREIDISGVVRIMWEWACQMCIELYRNVGKNLRILWYSLTFLLANGRSTQYLGIHAWLVGQLPLGPGDRSEQCIEMIHVCSRCS